MNSADSSQIVRRCAFARAGLLGNPSDGYGGKTISIIVRNYWAEVVLEPSDRLTIVPDLNSRDSFDSIADLTNKVRDHGYYGAVRLLKASIKRFYEFTEGDHLLHNRNFSISFSSNIPRQVGLAGSSAIITATLRGLMTWYDVSIPNHLLASLTLSVEQELGIPAGLQDRVIQAYEGVVYMDFDAATMQTEKGLSFGQYESISPKLLPNLYVAYAHSASEPTEVLHNDLRQRFDNGDREVTSAMVKFAEIAEAGNAALNSGQPERIHQLIDQNFDLRCSICQVQPLHQKMVNTARSVGASGKNCGSGGAIIGTFADDRMLDQLGNAMGEIGCRIIQPQITPIPTTV